MPTKNKNYSDISLILNKEESALILELLDKSSQSARRNIIFQELYKRIKNINLIWERRTKNEEIDARVKEAPTKRWGITK